METEQGFYTADLNVYYNKSHEDKQKNAEIYHELYFMQRFKYYKNTYKIFYAIEGNYNITSGNANKNITDGVLVISKQNEHFEFHPNMTKKFRFLFICIHPNLFANEDIEENYFRVFENLTNEKSIINLDNPEYENLINSLKLICDLIIKNYGRCHVKSACLSAITQMSLLYDNKYHTAKIAKNISVSIMHYINKHYTERLSYEIIKNEFSVSTPTINIIVKNATGMTFYNYINELRLLDAKKMLQKSWNISAKQIAELCGFNSYVAFYKAYVKKYGISPSEEFKTDPNLKYWPFSEK